MAFPRRGDGDAGWELEQVVPRGAAQEAWPQAVLPLFESQGRHIFQKISSHFHERPAATPSHPLSTLRMPFGIAVKGKAVMSQLRIPPFCQALERPCNYILHTVQCAEPAAPTLTKICLAKCADQISLPIHEAPPIVCEKAVLLRVRDSVAKVANGGAPCRPWLRKPHASRSSVASRHACWAEQLSMSDLAHGSGQRLREGGQGGSR